MSTMALVGIGGCPVAGWILDRRGSRKPVCVIPMIALLAIWPLAPMAGKEIFILLAFTIGLTGGFTPAGVFSATSEVVKDRRLRGMAMGVIQIGQNIGLLLGPVVFGSIIQFSGEWRMAYWGLVPLTAVGIVAGFFAKMD